MNKNPGNKVLMAVCNYFNPDNRVYRAADTLQEAGFNVVVVAYHKAGLKQEERQGAGFFLKRIKAGKIIFPGRQVRNYLRQLIWKNKVRSYARQFVPEFVHCHDYNTLFLGKYCKRKFGSKVIYDNHEYFQDLNYLHRYPLFIRKRIAQYERRALGKFVDEMIVVSPGIAEAYRPLFRKEIHVIRNIPDISGFNKNKVQIPAEVINFLEKQKKEGRKLFLYLGTNTQKGRGMDFTFQLLSSLSEDYGLVIFGAKSEQELIFLRQKADKAGITQRFGAFSSLPVEALFELRGFFYMGLSLIEPVYFSYLHSLPNKLFEYLAMELPVVSSDIPDQKNIIKDYNCGIILHFNLNEALNDLRTSDKITFNFDKTKSELTWAKEKLKLLRIYDY